MKFPPWWGYGYFLELHNIGQIHICSTGLEVAYNGVIKIQSLKEINVICI